MQKWIVLSVVLALACTGCADAAWHLGALGIDAIGSCLNNEICPRRQGEPFRPDCPPGADPTMLHEGKTVTWCKEGK